MVRYLTKWIFVFTKQNPFNCGSLVSKSEDQNSFCCSIISSDDLLKLNYLCHLIRKFSNFVQFNLSLGNFLFIHMKRAFSFLYYAASFLLVIAIVFYKSYIFWDCANGLVKTFSVHNEFNAFNNFMRFLDSAYNSVEVNVDVSYDGNHNQWANE